MAVRSRSAVTSGHWFEVAELPGAVEAGGFGAVDAE
jgi:hypothetical protein